MAVVISWNVNGLRAALKNGFMDMLQGVRPDILCLQESRVLPEELPEEVRNPEGYTSYWNPAHKRGYSGTAVFTREKPLSVSISGAEEFDHEGRLQIIEYPAFTILNGYWPNSQEERTRLAYKLSYCGMVTKTANALVKKKKNVIICGDFNIAHTEIDLARPKENENNPGYYLEEREAMTTFLKAGYVDTFRHFCPDPGHYSWWSYRTRGRERNVGWRLDYHAVNEAFLPAVKRAWILSDVFGSDHCPVGVEIDS